MIRTDYVKLTETEAVAYRQKLKSGGSGIVIIKKEYEQPGIAEIDKKGSLSYTLLNKDFIQFAGKSKIVDNMVQDKQSVADIIQYIVKMRLTDITGNQSLQAGCRMVLVAAPAGYVYPGIG